ncbi:MAG: serine hydrolase [Candidatus Zixiibacteriota bacterium]
MTDFTSLANGIKIQAKQLDFCGVIRLRAKDTTVLEQASGMANRAESIPNTQSTRFAIASGSKIFTAVSICQLVDKNIFGFDSRLKDLVDYTFPHFDPDITIHHLLTHSAGIPDYWDEETQEFEELWHDRPMYRMTSPSDFIPMFQDSKMRSGPGERFKYNDAGFILLGLVVEKQSGMSFREYVMQHIFDVSGMKDSGYFYMDRLPERTAYGYIENKEDGSWKTNFFAVPIVGGPDGGAYTTASDMTRFWAALRENRLLSADTTQVLITPQIVAEDEGADMHYGYGVWMTVVDGEVLSYNVGGWDPGVNVWSEIFPRDDIELTLLSNTNRPMLALRRLLIEAIRAD